MAAEPYHQQQQDTPISSFPDAKSSDDMSSSNAADREPSEKTTDAEANIPQQQKPVGGPPGGPPPNGGTTAWLQVLGGFFLFFNTWVCIMVLSRESLFDGQCVSCLPLWALINELNTNDSTGHPEHLRCISNILRIRRSLHGNFVKHLMDRIDTVSYHHSTLSVDF